MTHLVKRTGQITMSSVEDVKNKLGVTSASKPSTTINVGTNVSMANFDWICVHQDTNYQYLMTRYVIGASVFGNSQSYSGSTVALMCMLFGCAIGVWGNDDAFGNITVEGVPGYCHLATYAQMNGGFSYFNSDSRRIAYNLAETAQVYWTASPYSSGSLWRVLTDGSLLGGDPAAAFGFRPFVALKR